MGRNSSGVLKTHKRGKSPQIERGGGNVVFQGTWDGERDTTSFVKINKINKETEKAISIQAPVRWGEGAIHFKDIWLPKSTISSIEDVGNDTLEIKMKKSMVANIMRQNIWKGKLMYFEGDDLPGFLDLERR